MLQLTYDRYLFDWSAPGQDSNTIAALIVTAIQNSNKPAVIEPISKRVYLPDASLVLPASTDLGEIRYNYVGAYDGGDASAQVTLANAQNRGIAKIVVATGTNGQIWKRDPNAVFDAVPDAQACSRGLFVEFGTTYPESGKLQFTKQLADGRTMRVYKEAPGCSFDLQPLVEELRQAQSY